MERDNLYFTLVISTLLTILVLFVYALWRQHNYESNNKIWCQNTCDIYKVKHCNDKMSVCGDNRVVDATNDDRSKW